MEFDSHKKKSILISFIFVSVGVLSWAIINQYLKFWGKIYGYENYPYFELANYKGLNGILLSFSPLVLILIGIIYFLYNYLETGFSKSFTIETNGSEAELLNKKFQEIEKELDLKYNEILSKNIGVENIDELIDTKIKNEITDDILDKFEEKYSDKYIQSNKNIAIENIINSMVKNISNYIGKLSRNGTINLIIGVITTIIAVSILGFLVFENKPDFTNSTDVLSHYIPRISISIFIEIFSFFFLKLYRTNLIDVKYFQNERTNILSKILAYRSLQLSDQQNGLDSILAELMKTERNFKLKKGESTVELEKGKIENKGVFDALKSIADILKEVKK